MTIKELGVLSMAFLVATIGFFVCGIFATKPEPYFIMFAYCGGGCTIIATIIIIRTLFPKR